MHGQKNIKLWTWSCSGILKLLVWWKITNFSEDRNAFIFWMQTWGTNCRPLVGMWNRNAPTVCLETHKGVTHNWTHRLRKNHQNSCIYGNLQHLCKSIGRWETLNWILPAGWSDIPHFTRQHGRNSVLFRRPRHFEGTLVTALARSDADWLFLMGISERESLPKQTTNHRLLESKHRRRNSGSDSGRTGKEFPKYNAPGSILSGCKWWPLPAYVMVSSYFLHNEVSPLQISLQYPH